MITILIFLIITTSILAAYALNFQDTTLSIGKKLAPNNEYLPRGFQDAITPEMQNFRNITWHLGIFFVFILSFFVTEWYLAVLIGLGTFFILVPLLIRFMPKPESKHYLQIIDSNLQKKLKFYQSKGDKERMEAMKMIIQRFKKII